MPDELKKNDDVQIKPNQPEIVGENERDVIEAMTGGAWKKYARVAMAALSGIPVVGSVLGATATLSAENDSEGMNKLLFLWLQEHEQKLKELGTTLGEMFERFESFGKRIDTRIQSEAYLSLVRKTFMSWYQTETIEKKNMFKKLITNAGGISLVQDDWVRIFIAWIEQYDEFHFRVVKEIYLNPNISRRKIWQNIQGENIPLDNSSEADFFKLLIRDLSMGGVIRQAKESDDTGRFLKQKPTRHIKSVSNTHETAFEPTKPYVLTQLGQQFVHYVMEDLAIQLD